MLGSFRGRFADFSTDNGFVLTVADDRGVHDWEIKSGERVVDMTQPGLLERPVFTKDGRSITGIGSDGIVRTFPCPSCVPIDQLLAEADRRIAVTTPR
jgi:hypothetical protein